MKFRDYCKAWTADDRKLAHKKGWGLNYCLEKISGKNKVSLKIVCYNSRGDWFAEQDVIDAAQTGDMLAMKALVIMSRFNMENI
jgi:hypothetical protein